MHIDESIILPILFNLAGLVGIYTGLKVQIEVIATKITYIERRLKIAATETGSP